MAENLRSEATTATIPNDESRLEPISGASGDVSKGEPFDAGNMGIYFTSLCAWFLEI